MKQPFDTLPTFLLDKHYEGVAESYEADRYTFQAFSSDASPGIEVVPVVEYKMRKGAGGEPLVAGLELLVRERETGGSCQSYVEAAEKNGAMGPFVRKTIEIAIQAAKVLFEKGHRTQVAVNIPLQELDTETMGVLEKIATETPKLRELLELEITEREAFSPEHVRALKKLKALDYKIALDDFDTEHFNLNTFTAFPELWDIVTAIKIDKDPQTTDSEAFAEMIKVLESKNMQIIREGVEDGKTFSQLSDTHLSQGYLHGRPPSLSKYLDSLVTIEYKED